MEQKYKTKVIVAVADVLDETAARLAFEKFHKDAGKVDVLVHNAGYMSDLLSVQDSEIGEWWKSFEVYPESILLVRIVLTLISDQYQGSIHRHKSVCACRC